MRHLLLIRHAKPQIVDHIPAAQWVLSAEGKQASRHLVKSFEKYAVTRIITSHEPKAHETGCIPAKVLNLPCEIAPDLYEHDRTGEPFYSREVFFQKVEAFFNEPDKLIFGKESARQAQGRFDSAVDGLITQFPDGSLAIATHGTVMTLYVAQKCGIDPIAFWQQLKSPMVVVIELPDFTLTEVITEFS